MEESGEDDAAAVCCNICLERLPLHVESSAADAAVPVPLLSINSPSNPEQANSRKRKRSPTPESDSKQELVAIIEPCKHASHDGCLKQWIVRANSCPSCRAQFNVVYLSKAIGGEHHSLASCNFFLTNPLGDVVDSYVVQDKQQDWDNYLDSRPILPDNQLFDEDLSIMCMVCGEDIEFVEEGMLLCCTTCRNFCHFQCSDMEEWPGEDWTCRPCRLNFHDPSWRRERENGIDGSRVAERYGTQRGGTIDLPPTPSNSSILRRRNPRPLTARLGLRASPRHRDNRRPQREEVAASDIRVTAYEAHTQRREDARRQHEEVAGRNRETDRALATDPVRQRAAILSGRQPSASTAEERMWTPLERAARNQSAGHPAERPAAPERERKRPRRLQAQDPTESPAENSGGEMNGRFPPVAPRPMQPRARRNGADANAGQPFLKTLLDEIESTPTASNAPRENSNVATSSNGTQPANLLNDLRNSRIPDAQLRNGDRDKSPYASASTPASPSASSHASPFSSPPLRPSSPGGLSSLCLPAYPMLPQRVLDLANKNAATDGTDGDDEAEEGGVPAKVKVDEKPDVKTTVNEKSDAKKSQRVQKS